MIHVLRPKMYISLISISLFQWNKTTLLTAVSNVVHSTFKRLRDPFWIFSFFSLNDKRKRRKMTSWTLVTSCFLVIVIVVIVSSVFIGTIGKSNLENIHSGNGQECVPRDFGRGSVVCVCNSTYCDSAARNVPEMGQYRIYESGKDGKRMSQKIGHFQNYTSEETNTNATTIILIPNQKFQEMHGFGGAFTDSAGININRMSEGTQEHFFQSYFGENGSRYTLGRVPIAGTDFSTRIYTYDDHAHDYSLTKFQLAQEDHLYKIPIMQRARKLSPNLRFVSAAWTAPPWMKYNNNYTGYAYLKERYYQTYADYLTKFLVEYKNQGLDIWAITTGNEPIVVLSAFSNFNSMGWTPYTMAAWVAGNLGPTIANSQSNDTIILILDDYRVHLPAYPLEVFLNPIAKMYTAGIAVHWYFDWLVTPLTLDNTNWLFPEKFLLGTESCVGNPPLYSEAVSLGDWERAETYIGRLIENFNHWVTGYIDWNLALDQQGGPNWANNYVDSPIIVNPENDEFFKQPIYYAVAHFSKFIRRGSTRIGTTIDRRIDNVAFLTPENEIVVILFNRDKENRTIIVRDPQQGNITTNISPNSIQTIIYRV